MQVYFNAHIHTLNPQKPSASALAIDHGRILAIGEDKEILADFEGKSVPADLRGRIILPGLTDAHIHLHHYTLGLHKLNCETMTKQECLRKVSNKAASTPPGEWILGHGWNQNEWSGVFGNTADLDTVAGKNPVYLTAKSLHAGWANSLALERAGIGPLSSNPPGGQIQRDEQGKPTGILFENAMTLVESVIPEPKPENLAQAMVSALASLWRMGLTGVHDFDRQLCFQALQILHEQGKLKLRVTKSISLEGLEHAVEIGLRSGFGDDFLRIGSVKAFADGALGPRTAAMIQPYEGEPDNRGMLLLDSEELFEKGRLAVEHGLSLAVHAIGDRANHEVLNAFAQLRRVEKNINKRFKDSTTNQLRHRIEHVQVIHPDDLSRLAELDVIASMQPIHVISDYPAAERYWGKRADLSYAWRSLFDQGSRMAYGSDAPVESPNPFLGLQAAVTRCRPDGEPSRQGWHPDQKLKIEEALHGYTRGAAFAARMEDRLGMLAPGYYADLLVMEEDPLTCEPQQLSSIAPVGTMVNGEWVFREFE